MSEVQTEPRTALSALEFDVLRVCAEVTLRQHEMGSLLAGAIGVPENELLYAWKLRGCRQHGVLSGTDWTYFFHGCECDLKNTADGRFLRMDFGPRGSIDTFLAWGVLQFLMTSVFPWAEFPQLQARFAAQGPPYDQYSGSLPKFGELWDRLQTKGVFAAAAADLIAFERQHTTVGADGIARVHYPADTSDQTTIDCSVAHRCRLSPLGRDILEKQAVRGL